ncbi:hypothetical protein BGZ98_002325 [Dissophora globulifera]|nr:hypothetical protein BGZ98_002325 [Dissophora globulifera]
MTRIFKSLFVSFTLTLSVLQVALAVPCDSDCNYGYGHGHGSTTCVPVAPVVISPETDFLPITNVRPHVSVCPTEVHDYSDYGNYDCDNGFDGYGYFGDHDSDYCDSDCDDYDDCDCDCDCDCDYGHGHGYRHCW